VTTRVSRAIAFDRRAKRPLMILYAGLVMTACSTSSAEPVSAVAERPPPTSFIHFAKTAGPTVQEAYERRAERVRAITGRRWSCVPFARELSGVAIRGDAWTWWGSAAGRYERGNEPAVGAVLVLRKTGRMRRGHVAVVSRIVNDREIIVDHANWGWNRATRGRANWQMRVRDVSPAGDWSQTRFWYDPGNQWGTGTYPAYGFIYPDEPVETRPLERLPVETLVAFLPE
jgi:surface antigen